jgi:hypothetical protein
MRVYLVEDKETTIGDVTATHATVRNVPHKVEGVGHKVLMQF